MENTFYPETPREALAGIFDRLRARYTLAYSPGEDARDPGYHTITVHLASGSKQNYTIRSRAGYWR